jgi:hypothetical protein
MWFDLIEDKMIVSLIPDELSIAIRTFLDTLQNCVIPQTENVRDLIFRLNDAPPYFGRTVCKSSNINFLRRWTASVGPIPWPPSSPDLNPLDSYFWDYVEGYTYSEK